MTELTVPTFLFSTCEQKFDDTHQGCQVLFRTSRWNVGLLLIRCSGQGPHLAMTGEPRGFSRVAVPCSALKGETVPDSLPATPKSPPTRRVPPRAAGDLRELPRVPLRGEGSCGGGGAPRDSAGSGATAGTLIPSAQRLVWAAKQPLGKAALGALFA